MCRAGRVPHGPSGRRHPAGVFGKFVAIELKLEALVGRIIPRTRKVAGSCLSVRGHSGNSCLVEQSDTFYEQTNPGCEMATISSVVLVCRAWPGLVAGFIRGFL